MKTKFFTVLKPFWLWLIFYLFIFAWLINHSFSYLDNDYGWHLKFGRDIWQTKRLPEAQLHMWTLGDQTWVDHEWLSNLLIFGLDDLGGYPLVNVFFALIIVAMLIWLAVLVKKKQGHGDFLIMFRQTLGVLAIMGHLGVRVQEIGLIFFTTLLVGLNKYFTEKKLFKLSLLIFPLFWLWACFHASFVIGIIIVWLFIICKLIVDKSAPKIEHFFLAVCPVVATLLTPYGSKLYDLLAEYRHNAYMSQINEWVSITTFPIHYYKLLFLALVVASWLGLWLTEPRRLMSRQNLFSWALLVLLLGFSLSSIRHWQLFFVASHIFFLPLLTSRIDQLKNIINLRWLNFFVVGALLNLIVWLVITAHFNNSPFKFYDNNYPVKAVSYLAAHPELKKLKLLNHYDWGGYLIATLPDWPLFIDGRLPQKLYQGRTMIENFSDFNVRILNVRKLKDHQIELVLWKTKQQLYNLSWLDKFVGFKDENVNYPRNFLRYYLMTSAEWTKIYDDKVAEIYALKTALTELK